MQDQTLGPLGFDATQDMASVTTDTIFVFPYVVRGALTVHNRFIYNRLILYIIRMGSMNFERISTSLSLFSELQNTRPPFSLCWNDRQCFTSAYLITDPWKGLTLSVDLRTIRICDLLSEWCNLFMAAAQAHPPSMMQTRQRTVAPLPRYLHQIPPCSHASTG